MIKIGIYDRYLSTAGGGERYSCKAAQVLAQDERFDVELLTDIYADKDEVAAKLNLDLSRVGLRLFTLVSDDFAEEITREYDLFINCTYLSSLAAYAKKNLYLCYFPTPFDVDFRLVHRLLFVFRPLALILFRHALRTGFGQTKVIEGLYESKRFLLRRGSWAAKKARISFKRDAASFALGIKNPSSSPIQKLEVALTLSAGPIREEAAFSIERGQKATYRPKKETVWNMRQQGAGQFYVDLRAETFVPSRLDPSSEDSRELSCVVYDESELNSIKRLMLRAVGYIPLFLINYPFNLKFLDTYDKVVAISEYSRGWVKRYWGRDSEILFPPVDVESFKCTKKQDIILSVGRFFPEHHNKKQLELAKVFIELREAYPDALKGYRLCLAGGLSDKKGHQEYVRQIKEVSEGHPIDIALNISFEDLVDLFSRARIFWHAAGAGVLPQKSPEKFEHFGITTVEAMASGAIPIVIDKGGQVEIIREGQNGFLFTSFDELKKKTLEVIRDYKDLSGIIERAKADAKRFSNECFAKELLRITEDLLG
jgi:glycosyltransferase involved in cell wall biosynthesis